MRLTTTLLTFALALAGLAGAHTWPDDIKVIGGKNPGDPAKNIGHIRGFATIPGRVDVYYSYRMESMDAPICMPATGVKDSLNKRGQQKPFDDDIPLQVYPGNIVQATYLENGHVSKLAPMDNHQASGTIYWYGTTDTSTGTLPLSEVIQWTKDGKGGNGKGKLITSTNYDDTLCYEDNGRPVSMERGGKGVGANVPCVSQFEVPMDVKTGQYTVYWVWDFSTQPAPAGGKKVVEWYSSCFDLRVVEGKAFKAKREVPPGLTRSATFRGRL